MMTQNEALKTHEANVESFSYSGAGFIALPDGWRAYSAIDMKKNGGALISEGAFTKVQVWMPATVVNYSPVATTQLPGPVPATAPKPTFTYPEAPQFDLVVAQCQGKVPTTGENVKVTYTPLLASATSEKDCQTIDLDGSKNIFIAFNDLVGAYCDNAGDVRVMVKLIP